MTAIIITLSAIITAAVYGCVSLLWRGRDLSGARRVGLLIASGFAGSLVAWCYYALSSEGFGAVYFAFPLLNIALVSIYYIYYHAMAAGELTAANSLILSYPLFWFIFNRLHLAGAGSNLELAGFYILLAGTVLTIIYLAMPGKKYGAGERMFVPAAVITAMAMGICEIYAPGNDADHSRNLVRYYFWTGIAQCCLGLVIKYGFAGRRPELAPVHFMISAIGAMFFFASLPALLPFIIFPLPFLYLAPAVIFAVAWYFRGSGNIEGYFSHKSVRYTIIALLLMEILFLAGIFNYYYIRLSPAAFFLCMLAVISWTEHGEKFTYRKSFFIFVVASGLTLLNNYGINIFSGKGYHHIEGAADIIRYLLIYF